MIYLSDNGLGELGPRFYCGIYDIDEFDGDISQINSISQIENTKYNITSHVIHNLNKVYNKYYSDNDIYKEEGESGLGKRYNYYMKSPPGDTPESIQKVILVNDKEVKLRSLTIALTELEKALRKYYYKKYGDNIEFRFYSNICKGVESSSLDTFMRNSPSQREMAVISEQFDTLEFPKSKKKKRTRRYKRKRKRKSKSKRQAKSKG